jgi:transcriptional regulator with XRE-family HTH domain
MRGVLPNGQQIRTIRTSNGLTQKELSELADLDIKTIRKAEQGIRLDIGSVVRIASILQVEQSSLLLTVSADVDANYETVLRWYDCFKVSYSPIPGPLAKVDF